MSQTTYYYGEIVARISGKLYPIMECDTQLTKVKDISLEDIICEISADAGRVFDRLEDLSGEHFIDWSKALDIYANDLRRFMLCGNVPNMADMISLAAQSLEHARSKQLEKLRA